MKFTNEYVDIHYVKQSFSWIWPRRLNYSLMWLANWCFSVQMAWVQISLQNNNNNNKCQLKTSNCNIFRRGKIHYVYIIDLIQNKSMRKTCYHSYKITTFTWEILKCIPILNKNKLSNTAKDVFSRWFMCQLK